LRQGPGFASDAGVEHTGQEQNRTVNEFCAGLSAGMQFEAMVVRSAKSAE